ncbi:Mad3/BUB1 homology region 1 [Striga hermonthica]|uniref:Mad3/BUB1 homology region 1 n=1 Tax=Striga hermonthica TaxID=68872 RepID=A0A9N7NRP1_STRHE|nr:Mad3/BUB1 homology region 1 [Striga hermonthica]
MSDDGNALYEDLFSSLRSDIKSYNGVDPLLPWLRGIRKMKETLPPQLLKQKLPRFLQKCAETFLTDRRYSNDLRYIRVWLQLMDFLDDPKAALVTMEKNGIGMKKSLFYQAYALYYEKKKKFEAAEKIYHRGVQNLAEPASELHKSYDQFLHRMGRHKNKRLQLQVVKKNDRLVNHDMKEGYHNHVKESSHDEDQLSRKAVVSDAGEQVKSKQDESSKFCGDDTIVVKFVDTAIVGKSNAEDSRHHGLVEPTFNTKEAMTAINSMFREPIEPPVAGSKYKNQSAADNSKNGFSIFTDEIVDAKRPSVKPFDIYVDGEQTNDFKEKENGISIETGKSSRAGTSSTHTVFARPNDFPPEGSKDSNTRRAHQAGFREDTVVYRFVGSTISDEPEVENAWHHGLVDPTINLKEAMEDINSMFGKPIEFTRKSRAKKVEKVPDTGNNGGGFLILPDDEPENNIAEDNDIGKPMNNHTGFMILPDDDSDDQAENNLPSPSAGKGSDLFEHTVCTKEAMAEINKLFAMPMDF